MRTSLAVGVIGAIVFACSSEKSGTQTPSSGPVLPGAPDREVAKADIGPEGGSVKGERVTIEVPPGAVTKTTSFAIKAVDPKKVGLPRGVKATDATGGAYALSPDDIDFAKPVTVRVSIDKATVDKIGRGGFVLWRSEPNTNDWKNVGNGVTTETEIVSTTTHFSWWADSLNKELSCLRPICSVQGDPKDPIKLLPYDCTIPVPEATPVKNGVHCVGLAPDKGPPYECKCLDGTFKAKFGRLPLTETMIAMAKECGGACPPPRPPPACIEPEITGAAGKDWTAKVNHEKSLKCSYTVGGSTTCVCLKGPVATSTEKIGDDFPLANGVAGPPNKDELNEIWIEKCGGSCLPPGSNPDAGPPPEPPYSICDGFAQSADGRCYLRTGNMCRDGHYYDIDCGVEVPGDLNCKCLVDDVVTKSVNATCLGAWDACGFPAFPKK